MDHSAVQGQTGSTPGGLRLTEARGRERVTSASGPVPGRDGTRRHRVGPSGTGRNDAWRIGTRASARMVKKGPELTDGEN